MRSLHDAEPNARVADVPAPPPVIEFVIPVSVPAAMLVDQPTDAFGGSYVGMERGSVDDRPPCDTEPA